jgi:hypothetical protein
VKGKECRPNHLLGLALEYVKKFYMYLKYIPNWKMFQILTYIYLNVDCVCLSETYNNVHIGKNLSAFPMQNDLK